MEEGVPTIVAGFHDRYSSLFNRLNTDVKAFDMLFAVEYMQKSAK